MLRGLVILSLLLLISCSTGGKDHFEYPIQCKSADEVKYCEGHTPNNLDCRCLKIDRGGFGGYRIA
jgi:hypothetical protein